jgi:pseudaminic acid synthase
LSEVLEINNRFIGKDKPVYIIAEMSANHGGDKEKAMKIVDAAKNAGADCIKTQVYTPDTMTINSSNDIFKIKNGTWKGESLYNLYEKAYTPWEWQKDIKNYAKSIGIDFLATPFDTTSVDLLEELEVESYKIASFELIDIPLIRYIASKEKPIIFSTGMGSCEEIDETITEIKKYHNKICMLKCASAYPAKYADMNLKTIIDMKRRYNVPVGFSDHSLDSISAITSVAIGACVVEKHICLDRKFQTPDSTFSLEPKEFSEMVNNIRSTEAALGNINYTLTENEKNSKIFRRSIFVANDILKGDVFNDDNIRVIRPGFGLKPKYYSEIIGKKAKINVDKGTPLDWEMVE